MSVTLIVILAVAAALVLWGIKVQNQLVQSDELCNNALKQINVQQVSRYDALKAIVKLTREYASYESETLEKVIAQRKITAAANPTVDDINANEAALQAMSAKLIAIAEQYPDLKANQNYQQAMADATPSRSTTTRSACSRAPWWPASWASPSATTSPTSPPRRTTRTSSKQ